MEHESFAVDLTAAYEGVDLKMWLGKTLTALVLATGLAQGASAATVDFSSNGTGAAGSFFSDGTTYAATASGGIFINLLGVGIGAAAPVSVSGAGLGVSSFFGLNGHIDPGLSRFEMLTINFSRAVRMVGLKLSLIDNNDDFLVSIDGRRFQQYGPGLGGGPFTVSVAAAVQSIRILAVGGDADDIQGTIRNPRFNRDSFRVASASVVPLPAAGLLLLAGLGGLAAMRRRRARV